MNYAVTCPCGRSLTVRASEAGSQKECSCGAQVSIPSLSILRQSPQLDASTDSSQQRSSNPVMIVGIAILFALAVWMFSPSLLVLVGLFMVFAGRIWFAAQILAEMDIANAILVFIVPFMPTVFFFKRFDISWKPFFFGLAGFVLFLVGVATAPQ